MSKNRVRKRPTEAEILNDLTMRVLYQHYETLALNVFKWDGLPEGIEERYIERTLFSEGKALFFRDPGMSYMCLPCFNGSQLDVYGEPLTWRAMGLNYSREYRREECVVINNNKLRIPSFDVVYFFVRKLYEAERTMDTNIRTSKIPWLVVCDDRKLLTYKEVLRRVDANEPAIFAAEGLNPESFQLFPTRAPFLGNELMDYARSVEGQLLTFLGIDNCPVDKKERLVTGEVSSNDQLVQLNADIMLEARKAACEEINKLFGLQVSVELRNPPKEEVTADDPQLDPNQPDGSDR